ncbi:DUF5694 domain-containing protein [Pontibacter cellulosilyticus]|uniref:TraB/GumN family protein n=1 Tax=Pontibacter cellulosilyticus TaxID=1720253 RepID=A0A923N6N2_9BACT|nr:DUF5694 domain-containing protein [Pontibacter cellulosilyticus]MBC5993643.1 hypothetical protein [Pontibacter cellulosilyticus]
MKKLLVYLLACLLPVLAAGQSNQSNVGKPKILIVGTYHFGNPGLDVFNPKFDDMLAEKRQREIEQVLELLKIYKPTKVAVEAFATPKVDSIIQLKYKGYLAGTTQLTANEREQLGFRLAKLMGHQQVYCVDANAEFDFGKVMAFMQQNNQQDKLQEFMAHGQQTTEQKNQQIATLTLPELLYDINKPENILAHHQPYYMAMTIGKGTNYVGADLVADWYKRNIRIFANLNRIVSGPEERIILIIGAGHVKYLRDLIKESPDLEYVEANDYLRPVQAKRKQQNKKS